MTIYIDKNIVKFLTGIHENKESCLEKEILVKTFENAFRDMSSHTLSYRDDNNIKNEYFDGDNKRVQANKKNVKQIIMNYFYEYSKWSELYKIKEQEEFDNWHKDFCTYFIKVEENKVELTDKSFIEQDVLIKSIYKPNNEESETVFSCGQAQKLINMTLKFLYVYCCCEPTIKSMIMLKKQFFHVPLDTYVLKEIYKKTNNDHFKNQKYNGESWSKINEYNNYLKCQREIRKAMINGQNPFDWEMNGWPFGNNTSELEIKDETIYEQVFNNKGN